MTTTTVDVGFILILHTVSASRYWKYRRWMHSYFIPVLARIPWQMFELHTPLTQSDGLLHFFKSKHRGHVPLPPQSISVSSWFWTPSWQVGTGTIDDKFLHLSYKHTNLLWQILELHTPLTQSDGILHFFESKHRGHDPLPPQSTSLSSWFLTPSWQVGTGTIDDKFLYILYQHTHTHTLTNAWTTHSIQTIRWKFAFLRI